ncbi:MAG: prepilin-type N-terminal cleavage/methylation domain-containing protein [Candidatus Pelagisphaera sp.]|jgi:prepilin-type N-terminal cleavage/methylation domain-containing protein
MIRGAKRRVSGGFTLVEVMMAMALFGIAVVAFSGAYINVINAFSAIQVDQPFEQDLSLIRQQVLILPEIEDLEEGGEVFTGSHGQATWRVEYEPTLVADLFKLTLFMEILDLEKDKMQEVEETHYLTRPTWSDPVERSELQADTRDRLLEKQSGLD